MRTSGGWGIWVKRGGPSVASPSDTQKPCVQEKAVEQIAFPANGNGVPPMNGDVTSKLFEQMCASQHSTANAKTCSNVFAWMWINVTLKTAYDM